MWREESESSAQRAAGGGEGGRGKSPGEAAVSCTSSSASIPARAARVSARRETKRKRRDAPRATSAVPSNARSASAHSALLVPAPLRRILVALTALSSASVPHRARRASCASACCSRASKWACAAGGRREGEEEEAGGTRLCVEVRRCEACEWRDVRRSCERARQVSEALRGIGERRATDVRGKACGGRGQARASAREGRERGTHWEEGRRRRAARRA